MYLPDFDYYTPGSVEEACLILTRLGAGVKVIAGGTDLLPYMKNGVITPSALVSLKEIGGLRAIIEVPGKGVVIGAAVTHNDLIRSSLLQQRYSSISEAAHAMANHQVRNRGTIGGNLVSAVPSADLPPILIALKALITLRGPHRTRTVPLQAFFVGPRQTVLAPDDILTEIIIPDQETTGSAYLKFGLRGSGALAVVGVAVSVVAEGTHVKDAHIVLGAVGPTPVKARRAERLLRENEVTEALLEDVGRAAAEECTPISDIRGSEEYRREMVAVFTKRALRKVFRITSPGL